MNSNATGTDALKERMQSAWSKILMVTLSSHLWFMCVMICANKA